MCINLRCYYTLYLPAYSSSSIWTTSLLNKILPHCYRADTESTFISCQISLHCFRHPSLPQQQNLMLSLWISLYTFYLLLKKKCTVQVKCPSCHCDRGRAFQAASKGIILFLSQQILIHLPTHSYYIGWQPVMEPCRCLWVTSQMWQVEDGGLEQVVCCPHRLHCHRQFFGCHLGTLWTLEGICLNPNLSKTLTQQNKCWVACALLLRILLLF